MKQILYISDVNASEPIFHSQVVPHVNELRKFYDVKLLCLSRGEQYNYDYNYSSVLVDYSIWVSYVNFKRNQTKLFDYLERNNFDLIYSRGFRGGILGALTKKYFYRKKIKLVNDIRGDALDELELLDSFFVKLIMKFVFNRTTKFIFKYSDGLHFVSSYLRNKYCSIYKYKGKTEICPTFVPDDKFKFSETIRKEYRANLGYVVEDIVLLYSGNLAKWQNVDVILEAFEKCKDPAIKLLIITKDVRIEEMINSNNNKENIKLFTSDYNCIQNYYFTADYGLLIRDDIDTNRCSAPTKFSEYINSGLILISTNILSDYTDYLKSSSLSYVLINEKEELAAAMNSLTKKERNNVKVNTLSQLIDIQKLFFSQI